MPSIAAVLILLPTALAAGASGIAGMPAPRLHVWDDPGAAGNVTLPGNDVTDRARQAELHDPTTAAAKMAVRALDAIRDNGVPEDLPDPGVPGNRWHGPGGPWVYGDETVAYNYTCGQVATAGEHRTRDGAKQLRNMGTQRAVTRANGCARHWCRDTTALYVCNAQDAALAIPYYNVGWMADRLDRLCCDDNGGKAGQMWHYAGGYSVVLGYGNCQTVAATSEPYAYGAGNNAVCVEGGGGHGPPEE